MGLAPLVLFYPVVLVVLALLGSYMADTLITSNLRSNLASTQSYLEQIKGNTLNQVTQLVRSDRLIQLVNSEQHSEELQKMLRATAQSNGLDFLIVANEDGLILASSEAGKNNTRLPDSHVARQANVGVAYVAYESFKPNELGVFSSHFSKEVMASTPGAKDEELRGLLINAAAHFPLNTTENNTILLGGILLNGNAALIDHMREVVFPLGTLPDNAEGLTAVFSGAHSVAVSRQHLQGQRTTGLYATPEALGSVISNGQLWLGKQDVGNQTYRVGYAALNSGTGMPVGMISGAFPDAPYQRIKWMTLAIIGGLLLLKMLGITGLFINTGRELAGRLLEMRDTMLRVQTGDRHARVGTPLRNDELGQLAKSFDLLLETIGQQEQRQKAAQQIIADEVSRRRALFEHQRDGVVILNIQGQVLEMNPKAANMLGYSLDESQSLHVTDWDHRLTQTELTTRINNLGPEGNLFETTHHRKDASTYPAEVSVSRAEWNHQSFVLLVMRDISDRKAAEEQMKLLATTDGLTGVLNRRAWSEQAEQLVAQANRYQRPLAILSIDADKFKKINDVYGHPAGDKVLKALTHAMSLNLRSVDRLGRLGGEEFGIALPETDTEGALNTADRLLQAVRALRVRHGTETLSFTVSIGVAVLMHETGESLESLYKRADDALYEVKSTGRDRAGLAAQVSYLLPSSG